MAKQPIITQKDAKLINRVVLHFESKMHLFKPLEKSLLAYIRYDKELMQSVHSLKSRIKAPDNLRDKLERKILNGKKKGKPYDITPENLFEKMTDLVGIRILHLRTEQLEAINRRILSICSEQKLEITEGPIANCWDIEYEKYFQSLGITTKTRDSLYTSVHYIVKPNQSTDLYSEIQVRTLTEEVWGEVSHTVNYPHITNSIACNEQIKVLARMTSGCTRLVDSIFKSLDEHNGIK